MDKPQDNEGVYFQFNNEFTKVDVPPLHCPYDQALLQHIDIDGQEVLGCPDCDAIFGWELDELKSHPQG